MNNSVPKRRLVVYLMSLQLIFSLVLIWAVVGVIIAGLLGGWEGVITFIGLGLMNQTIPSLTFSLIVLALVFLCGTSGMKKGAGVYIGFAGMVAIWLIAVFPLMMPGLHIPSIFYF